MATTLNMIHCLLLPVHGKMLLPHATVAEIVPYSAAEPVPHAPSWLVGILPWRRARIPLVFFEGACGDSLSIAAPAEQKIVVLKTLSEDPDMPFIALVMQGLPRAIKVDADALSGEADESSVPLILKHIHINGQAAYLPNLDALEDAIKAALHTVNN